MKTKGKVFNSPWMSKGLNSSKKKQRLHRNPEKELNYKQYKTFRNFEK